MAAQAEMATRHPAECWTSCTSRSTAIHEVVLHASTLLRGKSETDTSTEAISSEYDENEAATICEQQ